MFNYVNNKRTINEIYTMFKNNELLADNSYQRRIVWLEKDMVRLIETILLNLVIPELFFWKSETDPDTGCSITHIVDGQQRVKSICSFINNDFKLSTQFLISDEIKEKYGNKYFHEFSVDEKKNFWNYQLMIIDIDVTAKKSDIINMFYRLNLTNYSLNDQEKRNSKAGEFAELAKEISDAPFWDEFRIFSSSDIRRMKDVEFCANLIILYQKGIVDQTDQSALNQAYEDMQSEYKNKESDKEVVLKAMEDISTMLKNDTVLKFARKKAQLYTLFSIIFYTYREKIKLVGKLDNLKDFVELYLVFSNKVDLSGLLDSSEKIIFDWLKRYKLASSEGLNKHTNRMIRFNVMRDFLFNISDEQNKAKKSLYKKLSESINLKAQDDSFTED